MPPVRVAELAEYDNRTLDTNLVTAKEESISTKEKAENDQMARERVKANKTIRVSTSKQGNLQVR